LFFYVTFFVLCFLGNICSAGTPFVVSSGEVSVDLERKTATFSGHASAKYKGMYFSAEEVTVTYIDGQSKIPKEIKARGEVVFKKDEITVTSNRCVYDGNVVTFSENVCFETAWGEGHTSVAKYYPTLGKIIIGDTENGKVKLVAKDKVKHFKKESK
jgi:lipopolysaccharide export system protein LptA